MEHPLKIIVFLLAMFTIISLGATQSHRRRGNSGDTENEDRRGRHRVMKQKSCYVCSGKFPDRDCELYPQYVTMGPGKLNCSKDYCSTIVRYRPKTYLLTLSPDKKLTGTIRPLTPQDFDVDSIARECEDVARGNKCEIDPDDLGITCYAMCNTNLCNKDVPSPKKYNFKKIIRATTKSTMSSPTTQEPEIEVEMGRSPEFTAMMNSEIGMEREMNTTGYIDEHNIINMNETRTDESEKDMSNKDGEELNEMGEKEEHEMGDTNRASMSSLSYYVIIEASFTVLVSFLLQRHNVQ